MDTGLALTAATMMYPFALRDGGSTFEGGVVRELFKLLVGRSVGQIHFHVVRHFFQEVRGNQTTVAIHLALKTVRDSDVYQAAHV